MTTGLSILALEQESKQAVIRLTLKDFLPQCICVVSVQYLCVAGIGPVIQEGLWEMDYPTLHKLIFQAIQSCPMDNRRHMYR